MPEGRDWLLMMRDSAKKFIEGGGLSIKEIGDIDLSHTLYD
jgi:hypothetical protein